MLSADARRDGRLSKRGATASRDGGRRRRSSSAALVATVQPAHFRELNDAAFRRVLDPSWRRGVFVQRQVCSPSVIVREIPPEHAQQVSFAEDDAVVSHASLVLSERHLLRVLRRYLSYYHGSRTHLSLDKDAPTPRRIQDATEGRVIEFAEVGGLHRRYERRAA